LNFVLAPKPRHALGNFFKRIGAANGLDNFLFLALSPVAAGVVGATFAASAGFRVGVRGIGGGIGGMVVVLLADEVGCARNDLRFRFGWSGLEGFRVRAVADGFGVGVDPVSKDSASALSPTVSGLESVVAAASEAMSAAEPSACSSEKAAG
jgi:hypothetical protein